VGQVEWVFPFQSGRGSLTAGLRLIWQRLERQRGGLAEDESAVGAVIGATL
jgi:hypothetical protein